MCERMHLVVRSILNRGNVHQNYELKKGDMLKLGRTKLLVRDINIVYKIDQIRQKNKRIDRYRRQYAKRQIKKAKGFESLDDSHRKRVERSHSPVCFERKEELEK